MAHGVGALYKRMGELILGTAQLGQPYGIANRTGQPDAATARVLVETAWEQGIRAFDTAPSYGASEALLGDAMRMLGAADTARIVTKLDQVEYPLNGDAIRSGLTASRNRLGVRCLDAVLIRRVLLDVWDRGLRDVLQQCVGDGIVRQLGVSVYTPDEALRAIATDGIAVVQLPTNVCDHRFVVRGVFDAARDRGVRVHIRSAFLQGILLIDVDAIPPRVQFARSYVESFVRVADDVGCSRLTLALAYLRAAHPNADVLVGAESPAQVEELTAAWVAPIPDGIGERIRSVFPNVSEVLLDPSRWPAAV